MSRPRAALLIVVLVAFVGGLGLWVWLPWNPFEGRAGPLDRMVPPDVDLVVRLQPRALRGSHEVDAVLTHPDVRRLLADLGETPVEVLEQRLDELTAAEGGDAGLVEDLFGTDVLIALRGEETLILSRVSGRARALALVERLGDDRLREFGVTRSGDLFVVDSEPPVHAGRYRDVLVLGTSPNIVSRSIATGAQGFPSLADEPGYDDALHAEAPPGVAVHAWLRPARFAEDVAAGEPGSAGAFWRSVFPPEALAPLSIEVRLRADESGWVQIDVAGSYAGEVPGHVTAMVEGHAPGLHQRAMRFATDETMIVCGVEVPAEEAVRALLGSQPPERRRLLDQVLEDEDLTVDQIARELGEHLEDGVGAVVARLREADDLELDDWDQGAVFPVPATLVSFALRDPQDPSAAIDRLRARAELLFGQPLDADPTPGPRGTSIHRLTDRSLGAEWALFRPCFAVYEGQLLFCTSEAYLRRALEAEPPRRSLEHEMVDMSGGQVAFEVRGPRFRLYVDDQRWEFAERATYNDWGRERKRIHAELDRRRSILLPEDREAYVDTRIQEQIRARNEELFPRAIREYRDSWRWLELFGAAQVQGRVERRAFRLEARVRVR